MKIDLDGDGLEEHIELYGIPESGSVYGNLTVGTEDGNWMDLIGWAVADASAWECLSCEPYTPENLPDNFYVQITCLDLNPYDQDGREIIVSLGDLKSESVSIVYHYTGVIYEDENSPNPADYMGRMWGGANFKVDANLNMESELLKNPYQTQNVYRYTTNGVESDWQGEADYKEYRYAAEGNLSLEEWHNAFATW